MDVLYVAVIAIVSVYLFEGFRRLLWAVMNYLADMWIRRNGWDEGEMYVPMVDYTPVWCVFTGVDHLTPPKRFNRNI